MERMAEKAPKYSDAVDRYIEHGIEPGSFLTAVLENDLMQAFARADHHNQAMMREWAGWLYMHGMPYCFGSHKIVNQWIDDGGLSGQRRIYYRGKRLNILDATASDVSVEWRQGPRGEWTELEHIVRHSPTGMAWGYMGSGPADLAFSILSHHLGDDPEPALYQEFKNNFVAGWGDSWEINSDEIKQWLENQ